MFTEKCSHLAPPWSLTLTPPSVVVQLAIATAGRPILSLRREILVVMLRDLIARSKEPLSFLLRTRGGGRAKEIHHVVERILK